MSPWWTLLITALDEDIRPMLETQAHALRFVEHDLTAAA
jgi:hypothetical protein